MKALSKKGFTQASFTDECQNYSTNSNRAQLHPKMITSQKLVDRFTDAIKTDIEVTQSTRHH